jgi:uncharacterized membrane protein YedE/YeeE
MSKRQIMSKNLISFLVGFIFALGLGVAGMTQPQKVIGFLDLRDWNPSLLAVMAGAILVHGFAYPVIRRRHSPLLDPLWHVPTRKDVTTRLILGSAIFGIGWGLGGFCPGPALTAFTSGDMRTQLFVVMMILGMFLFIRTENSLPLKR